MLVFSVPGPLFGRARRLVTWVAAKLGLKPKLAAVPSYREMHTRLTFRALIDAVIPESPDLDEDRNRDDRAGNLGRDIERGGLSVDLDEFLIEYADSLFQFGLPHVGPRGNLPIAAPVANLLDIAALKLISRGRNRSDPDISRVRELAEPMPGPAMASMAMAGPFTMLSRKDRLRAISLLDEFDLEVAPFRGLELEIDGGLVGQLVVGFSELLFYSEGTGYDAFFQPPSERNHSNDPEDVLGWRQTGYPGAADGYDALRGYLGSDGPLGGGEAWRVVDETSDPPISVMRESGSFRENEYDTSEYEEVFPEEE